MAVFGRSLSHRAVSDALTRPEAICMRIADFPVPDTSAARGALELATQYQSADGAR